MKKNEVPALVEHTFIVHGKERMYLSNVPATPPAFALIVFHGNGGTADGFAKKYPLHGLMSGGLIVYFQGIPGIGGGFDPKGLKNGWQRKKGDGEDRDLYAIDELVKVLIAQYPGLKDKVYAMGHSNGGRFTYLLWSERASLFKGFIINAHQGVDLIEKGIEPRSAMIITGRQDRVVNNANQFKSVELIKTLLQPDHTEVINEALTIYSNKKSGLRLHHYIHGGGHDLPKTALPFVSEFLSF
jgi:polyhydroxybutyrate depolymerase